MRYKKFVDTSVLSILTLCPGDYLILDCSSTLELQTIELQTTGKQKSYRELPAHFELQRSCLTPLQSVKTVHRSKFSQPNDSCCTPKMCSPNQKFNIQRKRRQKFYQNQRAKQIETRWTHSQITYREHKKVYKIYVFTLITSSATSTQKKSHTWSINCSILHLKTSLNYLKAHRSSSSCSAWHDKIANVAQIIIVNNTLTPKQYINT